MFSTAQFNFKFTKKWLGFLAQQVDKEWICNWNLIINGESIGAISYTAQIIFTVSVPPTALQILLR